MLYLTISISILSYTDNIVEAARYFLQASRSILSSRGVLGVSGLTNDQVEQDK